ncbi:exopolysaccharide biosynthesis polyprenyl glycosylphosphotransferase [Epilithonimonas ginsengisoli]|uniref:Exopolysaccharide biosynthesis polyprenyl glycosylphosphotransferase n=1 Tax=Epilithonimonas ginsengisoli TaxID=1245592 RepID=A0ABU4JKC7_9FLAO|nr:MULTISPECIES: exopolysaccharide biosynthesis polyprenyl glycosylphosphotransferase [Chryseobacterium group]MBV6881185.1 exopolysaccharide biosynthesis polyprenyl glycosylphosphotransferase [Epilithonimonas sp. FP105]MDW8550153.1 exopolysaccharide biosynthesis polyprenyl glycosylphosphotransferase [Epilithonimonas ginsengisoli]OAH70635.1 glycosyl transferase [Chryseobacterium sp. FP211-J200]
MQRLRYSRYFKTFVILLDMILVAAVFCFYYFRNFEVKYDSETLEQNLLSILLLCFFWLLLSGRTRLYHIPRNVTYTIFLERIFIHVFFFFIGVVMLGKVSNNDFLKTERFYLAGILLLVVIPIKSFIYFILKYLRSIGINHRNVMFIGESASSDILIDIINQRKDYGYKIYNFSEDLNIPNIVKFWKDNGIHTIFLPSGHLLEKDFENALFRQAEINKVRISLVPNIIQNDFFEYEFSYIETVPILSQAKYPLDFFTNLTIKRLFDIVFSLIVLIGICSWLFPIIILLIKMNDPKGSVFFIQKRYGYHDEVFNCLKFRTMKTNSGSSERTTDVDDERITKIGKFLRKTSMDELPQFINVLLGDMTIVGPRPHMLLVDDFYKPKISRYSLRSMVKPGITGLAQVSGLRGDEGDMNIGMKKRILADSFYVRNWSFSMDIVIILKTIFLIIVGDKNAR